MNTNTSKTKKPSGASKERTSKGTKRREIPPLAIRTRYNADYELLSGVLVPWTILEGLHEIAKVRGYPDLGFSVRAAIQGFLEDNISVLLNSDRAWFQKVANNLTELNDAKPDAWGLQRVKRLHEMYDKIRDDDNKLNPEN